MGGKMSHQERDEVLHCMRKGGSEWKYDSLEGEEEWREKK
jgi:hypothetical protein